MRHFKSILNITTIATLALLLTFVVASCSMMHEDMSGCKKELRVRFVYDMNMKYADAFASQVKTVTLHAYNLNGDLVFKKTEKASDIAAAGGYMTLDINPCIYTLQVWAEGEERQPNSYIYTTSGDAASDVTKLDCKINRTTGDIQHDLTALYHGYAKNVDMRMLDYGVKTVVVPLTKNTNNVKVVIQNAIGVKLNATDFDFKIEDDNGWLAYDNAPVADQPITYHPWSQYDGVVSSASDASTQVSAVVAEMTVNRLLASKNPRLKVYNNLNNKLVFSIPLIDYALLVKGNYNKAMTDQEYLDRQDDYSFTFFVDDHLDWLNATIYVNSWRVVLQNVEM